MNAAAVADALLLVALGALVFVLLNLLKAMMEFNNAYEDLVETLDDRLGSSSSGPYGPYRDDFYMDYGHTPPHRVHDDIYELEAAEPVQQGAVLAKQEDGLVTEAETSTPSEDIIGIALEDSEDGRVPARMKTPTYVEVGD